MRRCTRSPTRSRPARRRSSRPTPATWRAGREAGLSAALLDRLRLDEGRIAAIAAQVRDIAALRDPVGELIEGFRLPNGLDVRKERVPLGVVAVVYEARPNVTIDAAALCLKSGNAIVLRGSSSAAHSNAILASIAAEHAPEGAVGLVQGGREALADLARAEGLVDLIIPRGGEGLKAALREVATVPVIYAASGNCHVYVDASADPDMARAIVLNAKTQRPGVCNAAETLLVHVDAAPAFLPGALRALRDAGVELRVDGRTRALAGDALASELVDATDADWDEEFLALVLAVRIVDSARRRSTTSTPTVQAIRRRSSPATRTARAPSASASTPPASTSTRRRASPTVASSAWAPRSATRRRSSTPAARSPARAVYVQVRGRRRRPRARMTATLGLLGGTFNPPHVGHLVLAQEARDRLGLDRVALVPVAVPPHKEAEEDPGAAVRPRAVSRRGRGGRGPRGPRRRDPARGPVVHGRYPEGTAWDGGRPDLHRRRGHGAQPPRRGASPRRSSAWRARRRRTQGCGRADIEQRLGPLGARIEFFEMPRIDVSSTDVRARVASGRPVRWLVPDAVATVIEERGLYR